MPDISPKKNHKFEMITVKVFISLDVQMNILKGHQRVKKLFDTSDFANFLL